MFLINLLLRLGLQGAAVEWEDRHIRVLQVESLKRVADRLLAATRLFRNPAGDLRTALTRLGETPRPLDHLMAIRVRQSAEPGSAANPLRVVGCEAIHGTLEKADLPAAVRAGTADRSAPVGTIGKPFSSIRGTAVPTRQLSARDHRPMGRAR